MWAEGRRCRGKRGWPSCDRMRIVGKSLFWSGVTIHFRDCADTCIRSTFVCHLSRSPHVASRKDSKEFGTCLCAHHPSQRHGPSRVSRGFFDPLPARVSLSVFTSPIFLLVSFHDSTIITIDPPHFGSPVIYLLLYMHF